MSQPEPPKPPHISLWHRYLPALLTLMFGVGFSLAAFFAMRWWELQNIHKAFRLAANERSTAVKSEFDTEVAMMELVRAGLIADGRIDRDEFRQTLAPFLTRRHSIQAVEWVPRVLDAGRAEFEAAAQREGIDGFQITELDKNGQVVRAARRDEYFPIDFIGPRPGEKAVYGLDLISEAIRFESLRLARDTGETVASGQIELVQDANNAQGFLVYLPVYEKDKPIATRDERRKSLFGFILGVFQPQTMIEAALDQLRPEGIDVALYDPSVPVKAGKIAFHASRTRDERARSLDVCLLTETKNLRAEVPLGVAGHPWTVVCMATSEFVADRQTWWPWGVLAAGLAFTALLAVHLAIGINRTEHLEEKVRAQTADIRSAQEEVIDRLAAASAWRDEETGMHIRRTGLLAEQLARSAGWFGEEVDAIRQAAPMHDLGKIGIPDAILRKNEALTPEETEVMKTHAGIGGELLSGSKAPMLQMARDIAQNHHEHWDGKGYPRGISGKDIPESARLVSIVDMYDALMHDRVYRPAMPEAEVLPMMQQGAGTHFDPDLLAAFFRCLPEMRRILQENPDERTVV